MPTANRRRCLLFASLNFLLTVLILAGLIAFPGCGSVSGTRPDDTDTPSDSPRNVVAVRLLNATPWAVTAELYVSTNGLASPASELFVDENLYLRELGLASSGLLQPATADAVNIQCTDGLTVGTTGGSFRDPDTGEVLGEGEMRILQQGLVFDCGDQITFVYSVSNDAFSVDVSLE